jgi:hypothetical protein
VVDRPLTAEPALAALAEVEAERLERPSAILLAAYALAGVSLTVVLGGGMRGGPDPRAHRHQALPVQGRELSATVRE